jgi:D-Tyr-tRNAtyr deacylase
VFCSAVGDLGVRVETGVFAAGMLVELVNDGPVTIVLD